MSKNIELAHYAGFCQGVKRAVDTTKQVKAENKDKNVFVLGELIHNSYVIQELENLGIITANSFGDCDNCIYIVRSHGMPPDCFKEAEKSGVSIVDLTCPNVKKVQKKAIELAKEDYPVLIIGKSEHPEVIAIKANALQYSDKVFVISDVSEVKNISDILKNEKKAGVVVQTTQKRELLREIVSELVLIVPELKIFNTICKSTELRQKETEKLAVKSDLMVVIGGKNSANTTHLAEISKKTTPTIHIESVQELDVENPLIKNAKNIGVTAGASTPDKLIKDVINKLKSI